jgi:hypothetical protein
MHRFIASLTLLATASAFAQEDGGAPAAAEASVVAAPAAAVTLDAGTAEIGRAHV